MEGRSVTVIPGYDPDVVEQMAEDELRVAAESAVESAYDLDVLTEPVAYRRRRQCDMGVTCFEREEDVDGFPELVSRDVYTDIERLFVDENGGFHAKRCSGDDDLFRYQLLFSFPAQTRFVGDTLFGADEPVEFRVMQDGARKTLEIRGSDGRWTVDDGVTEPAQRSEELRALETLEELYQRIYRDDCEQADGTYTVDTSYVTEELDALPAHVGDTFQRKVDSLKQNLALGLEPHQCQLHTINTYPALLEMYLGKVYDALWADTTQLPDELVPKNRALYAVDIRRDGRSSKDDGLHKGGEVRVPPSSTIKDLRMKQYAAYLPDDLIR